MFNSIVHDSMLVIGRDQWTFAENKRFVDFDPDCT